jgi:hypothetical protein
MTSGRKTLAKFPAVGTGVVKIASVKAKTALYRFEM